MKRINKSNYPNDQKMYWIALVPLLAFTWGAWQFIVCISVIYRYLIDHPKINFKFLIGLFSLCIIIFPIGPYLASDFTIFANVYIVENRTHGTIGNFSDIGSTNYAAVLRFIIYIFVVFLISKVNISERSFIYSLKLCVFSFVGSMALVFIMLNIDSGYLFLKEIARQIPGEGNFLVRDSFGYRISGGFTEPSVMSVFMGTVFAILFLLRKSFFDSFMIFLLLFLMFMLSRSLAGFIVFLGILMAVRAPIWFMYVLLGAVFISIPFIRDFVGDFMLFRSINERLHIPDFTEFGLEHFLFGVGFGNTYAFVPLVNHVLQFGVIGMIVFFLMFNLELRSIMAYLVISFVSPQLWFPIQFICFGLLLIYIRNFGRKI